MENRQSLTIVTQVVVTISFLIGACGNIVALWVLYKSAKRRNRKHVLLLRCLALNDLFAQVGMAVLVNLDRSQVIAKHGICVCYVIFRAFGLGSGCVAFVMALERWLALTRPFFYHQVVTYLNLKRFLFAMWIFCVCLCYLPLFGFGVYFNNGVCARYREAVEVKDKIYAYFFLVFGTALVICISMCNLTVVWELSRIRQKGRVLIRRVSRSNMGNRISYTNYQTPEEVAFSKMMVIICVIFCICWAPQMISIPLVQFYPKTRFTIIFSRMANVLMCIYFTLDPFIYVLQRYMERGRCFFTSCFSRRRSMSSIPTTTTAATPTSVLLNPPSFSSPVVM